jgi:hypothetical protein
LAVRIALVPPVQRDELQVRRLSILGDKFANDKRVIPGHSYGRGILPDVYEFAAEERVFVEPGHQPARQFDGAESVVPNGDLTEGIIVLPFGQHLRTALKICMFVDGYWHGSSPIICSGGLFVMAGRSWTIAALLTRWRILCRSLILKQLRALLAEGELIVVSPDQIFGQDHFQPLRRIFRFPLRLIKRQSGEKTPKKNFFRAS